MTSCMNVVNQDRSKYLAVMVCGFLVSITLGCVYQPSYLPKDQQGQQQNYEIAIQTLEEARVLAYKRGDHQSAEQYANKLQAIKLEAADVYYRKAKRYFTQADLNTARLCINHAIRYRPDAIRYYDLRHRIQSTIEQAEQQHAEAMTLADRFEWHEAIALLEEACQHHQTLTGAYEDLKRLKERAYQYYIALAEKRLEQHDLDGATQEAKQALTFRPHGSEARRLLDSVEDRLEATHLIDQAQHLLEQDRPNQALPLLEQAAKLHRSSPELDNLLLQTKKTLCDRWMDQGKKAMQNQEADSALTLFLMSQDLMPGYGRIDEEVVNAKAQLAQSHLQQARDFLHQRRMGAAVLQAIAALAYNKDSPECRDVLQKSVNQVQEAIVWTVAFGGFVSRPEYQTIADKMNISMLTVLDQLHLTGVQLISHVADAQAVIRGEILEAKMSERRTVFSQGKAIVEVGLRSKPNPEYMAARQEMDLATAALEEARGQLLTAQQRQTLYAHPDPNDAAAVRRRQQAEADVTETQKRLETATAHLTSVSTRLKEIPPEVREPRLVTYEYPIYMVEKTANITCVIRIVDRRTQAVLMTEQMSEPYTVSDKFVEADPAKNVTADPLALPHDDVIYEHAMARLIGRLQRVLNQALSRHCDRFVTAFRHDKATDDQSGALDNAIKFLFSHPESDEQTEAMVLFIRTYLGKEDALLDITALLRTYGHVLKIPSPLP